MSSEPGGRTDVAAALAEADELAGRDEVLTAIERLQHAYRSTPDPLIARRMVELRHAGFDALPKEPGRPTWPVDYPDHFPGVDGIVEIPADGLSGELLGSAITNHGLARVDGLIDEATAARLRDRIEQAFQARERLAVDGAPVESAAPWFVPYTPGRTKAEGFGRDRFVRVVDAPDVLCDLVEIFTRTGVRSAVEEYLGERPAMIANKWILRRSTGGVPVPDYHQDGAFLGDGIRTIDCWIALSHCGPGTGNPAVDVVAGRVDHILPTGEGATLGWALGEATIDALPAPVLSPVFAPGDALFFDEQLPHRTTVGPELGVRYAIESWFVAPSSYPSKHLPVVL